MAKLKIGKQKIAFLRIILFLVFITNYELRFTDYELFAQDKIIAIVNKDIITQKDLNDFINFMRVQLAAQYQGEQLETKIQSMKLDLLDKLIEDRLILQEAKKDNIKINPDRIKVRVSEIKNHYSSDSEFQNSLAKQGLVQADLEEKIKEQLLMYTVIDIEIRSKIIIKPGEVTDFYQENTGKFILSEQREFESVTVDNEILANEVFEKLKSGQELQGVANKYSLTVNKFSCARGDGQLRKDIEDAIFKMNLAQLSIPVKIQDNYYIFKLNNIIPPRHQNLSEVQDGIYMMLFNKKMQEALTKWLDELKERSYIKILQT
jgi:parvulin-like peptidyl-prolyl isomerase